MRYYKSIINAYQRNGKSIKLFKTSVDKWYYYDSVEKQWIKGNSCCWDIFNELSMVEISESEAFIEIL